MKRFTVLIGIAALCAGGAPSCKQGDAGLTALIDRREAQKAEIASLKAELSKLDGEVKAMPADPAPRLAAATKQLEAHQAEVPGLEAEAAELGRRRRDVQREFEAYRAKYPAP